MAGHLVSASVSLYTMMLSIHASALCHAVDVAHQAYLSRPRTPARPTCPDAGNTHTPGPASSYMRTLVYGASGNMQPKVMSQVIFVPASRWSYSGVGRSKKRAYTPILR